MEEHCKIKLDTDPCSNASLANESLNLCNQQSDIMAMNKEFMPGPNRAIMTTPLSFVQKTRGLEDIRPTSGPLKKLPDSWSWCADGGNKISPVADQGKCGSCWAVASTTALADRYGLKYNIEAPSLSFTYTMLKIGTANGPSAACQCSTGGSLVQAGCGFESGGILQEQCYPYDYISHYTDSRPEGPVAPLDSLTPCCSSDEQSMLFTAQDGSTRNVMVEDSPNNINVNATHMKLKAEIANNGPVAAAFQVYDDFQDNYIPQVNTAENWEDVGVYTPTGNGNQQGGHAVVITGWGTKDGIDFWEVRNSWGTIGAENTNQGVHKGYFKYAIVDNDPCHLAAPFIQGGSMVGGGVSFLPGPLPKGYKAKPATGKRKSPDNYGNGGDGGSHYKFFSLRNSNGDLNWPFIATLVLVAAIVVALLVQLIPKKK